MVEIMQGIFEKLKLWWCVQVHRDRWTQMSDRRNPNFGGIESALLVCPICKKQVQVTYNEFTGYTSFVRLYVGRQGDMLDVWRCARVEFASEDKV